MQVPPAQNRPRELKISGSPCFYAKNVWFHLGKDPFLFLLSPYPNICEQEGGEISILAIGITKSLLTCQHVRDENYFFKFEMIAWKYLNVNIQRTIRVFPLKSTLRAWSQVHITLKTKCYVLKTRSCLERQRIFKTYSIIREVF